MQNDVITQLQRTVDSVIRGKQEAVKMAIVTLLGRGNLLIEDVPGVGKTTLAYAIARATGCEFQRIQFTSDMMPADIIGVNVYNPETREFEFRNGPIFSNIVLADEINRTGPKTQSALLEAMNEKKITVEHRTFMLPDPFMVIATQNPIEYHGTFPLPESQLDRFMLHLKLGYPEPDQEKRAVAEPPGFERAELISPVATKEEIHAMQAGTDAVTVDESVMWLDSSGRSSAKSPQLAPCPRCVRTWVWWSGPQICSPARLGSAVLIGPPVGARPQRAPRTKPRRSSVS